MKKLNHPIQAAVILFWVAIPGAGCVSPVPPCPAGAACIVAQPILASGHLNLDSCDPGPGGLGGDNLDAPVATGYVGWDDNMRGNRLGARGLCDSAQYFYRTALYFNQTVIDDFVRKRGLLKATLEFVVPSNLQGQPIPLHSSFQRTCVASVGQANDQNWFGEDPSAYDPTPYSDPIRLPRQGPHQDDTVTLSKDPATGGVFEQISLTPWVREWVIGRRGNNGLVLAGPDESGSVADGACESTVQSMRLVLYPFTEAERKP